MSLPSPLLAVTDRHGARWSLTDTVRALLDGGARWVWFRDRDLEPEARRDLARDLLDVVRAAGGRLTIGGDASLAAEIGADAVHLGGAVFADPESGSSHPDPHPEVPASAGLEGAVQPASRSLETSFEGAAARRRLRMRERVRETVADARRRLGPDALVGLSAHSLGETRAAAEAGADYVTLSPIFASPSKPGYGPALGPDALAAAAACGLPVVALGGVGADNARVCTEAGAAGVAVMGRLMGAADPAAQARHLLRVMAT